MPELAEVEIIRRSLEHNLIPGYISVTKCFTDKFFEARNALRHRITSISREGKFLVFGLTDNVYDDEREMIISLGMTGKLILSKDKPSDYKHLQAQWVIVQKTWDDTQWLSYYDARKFGSIRVVSKGQRDGLIKQLGPDPLEQSFVAITTIVGQFVMLGRYNKPIKQVLLEQKFAAGIGNYLADEILFRAGIHPETWSSLLELEEVEALNKQTVAVVTDALAHGGNSFSNYVQTDGEPGGFYNHMMVYGREGLGCKVCKQKIIIKIKVAGRGTHFCYNCQPKRING